MTNIPNAAMHAVTAGSDAAAAHVHAIEGGRVRSRVWGVPRDTITIRCDRCEQEQVLPMSDYTGPGEHDALECFEYMAERIRTLSREMDNKQDVDESSY